MPKRFKELPLERQLFLSFISVASAILLLTLGITLYYDIERQNRAIDATIRNTAAYIAAMEPVARMLENGYPDDAVGQSLDSLYTHFSDLNVILICNRDGLRFYHSNRQQSGETFVEGDEAAILAGAEPYITTGYGTHGIQRRAFCAVRGQGGEITGFVMCSVFQSGILERNRSLAFSFLLILGGVFVVGLLLSRELVRLLTRSLRGHHPAELLNLYLRQDDVLNSIEDGLVATDADGAIVVSNTVARRLFRGEESPLQGQKLRDLFPETGCEEVARTGRGSHNRSCVIRDRQVLVSEVPIRGGIGNQGALNIFHDKTEMMKMSDELSGTRYMLDTLRFFNHEFMNKLHIILGYLQTGETKRAIEFIVNSSLVSSQSIRATANCIRVSRLCALIIGKMMHAAELGILLTVSQDSFCIERDLLLPIGDCVTILGNLLENAIEELSESRSEVREIKLSVYCRPDCNLFVCEDTGGGVRPEILPRIFEKGVSSKGENRGLGLSMLHQIVTGHGGAIEVETEEGAGSCFTVTFTKEEAMG